MIELLNIDCMEYMAGLPDKAFNLAIVDPPYGININMNMGRRKGQRKKHQQKNWDDGIPGEEYFNELFRISKNQIIWGGNYFSLPVSQGWIYWDKIVPEGMSFSDGELAWTSFNQALKKVRMKYSGYNGADPDQRVHPTQKPIQLYKWILKNYASQDMNVIDTHLGSGSSAIAASDFGCKFVGCEIDTEYFNAAKRRLDNHRSQYKLII